jgi:hypothetical protein
VDKVDGAYLPLVRAARGRARAVAWAGGAGPDLAATGGWLHIDIDATIVIAHSDKENAAATWKRTYGFHPPGPVGDRARQIHKPLPRLVEPRPPIGISQRPRHQIHQTRSVREFPQQRHPSPRRQPPPVRADPKTRREPTPALCPTRRVLFRPDGPLVVFTHEVPSYEKDR